MDTPARLLRLLTLMSSRARWRADELAERFEVTERSVRRDITRLRELGYPIQSVTGPYGGYSLGAGGRLPPLLLDDDEAVSIAVALHDVAQRSAPMIAEAALSALTKLGQVLPTNLRERVAALTAVVVEVERYPDPFDDSATNRNADEAAGNDIETLMSVALACERCERVRFDYRSGEGAHTMRHTEPFRLVSVRRRWYLVAYDLDRGDWRTFRLDRISRVRNSGARFERAEPLPDAAKLVAAGLAVNAYDSSATVRFFVSPERASHEVSPTVGIVRGDPDDDRHALVEIGGDADWIARYVASMPFRCEVLDSPAVREEMRLLGARLMADNS